jgi:hypothetical protein
MFCPRCGQQQPSDAARFCSRCGFRLEAVAGLLVTGGVGPDVTLMEAAPAPPSPKRKGAQLGGKLMLTGMFLGPALAALGEAVARYADLGLVGLFVFLAGLFRLMYALIFEDGPYRRQLQRQPAYVPPAQVAAPPAAAALPPPTAAPARGYAPPRAETGEIAYRPSVTEGTTRLLGDERDERPR